MPKNSRSLDLTLRSVPVVDSPPTYTIPARRPAAGYAVGLGLTNECNLECSHCYRDPLDISRISLADVQSLYDSIPIASVNLGTGENGLHPDFVPILDYLHARGVRMSVTSNGYTLDTLDDAHFRMFREVELSVDFPTQVQQDAFRGPGNWDLVWRMAQRARDLGVERTITAVMMTVNYSELAAIAHEAATYGANFRVNVYQPMQNDTYALSYDQFWEGFQRLFSETELISCGEPIVNVVLGRIDMLRGGCGHTTVRVSPRGEVFPCIYWPRRDQRLPDLYAKGEAIVETAQFEAVRTLPEMCRSCAFVDACAGGCGSRRKLQNRLDRPDEYCPIALGREMPHVPYTAIEGKTLLKSGSACTTIVRAIPPIIRNSEESVYPVNVE